MNEAPISINDEYTQEEKDKIKLYAKEYLYDPNFVTPNDSNQLKQIINSFVTSTTNLAVGTNKDVKLREVMSNEINKSLQTIVNYFALLLGESDFTNEGLVNLINQSKQLDLDRNEIITILEGLVHIEHLDYPKELQDKNNLNCNSIRSKLGQYQIKYFKGDNNEGK